MTDVERLQAEVTALRADLDAMSATVSQLHRALWHADRADGQPLTPRAATAADVQDLRQAIDESQRSVTHWLIGVGTVASATALLVIFRLLL